MRVLGTALGEKKGTKGLSTAAKRQETEVSLQGGRNPLWDLPYGANPRGVYGACPPEVLHQYLMGIMKYAYVFTWNKIDGSSPSTGKGKSATATRVDERFKLFDDRHVDPELPRRKFRKGVYELPYLEGKDYRALLLQFIVVLGVDGRILDRQEAADLQGVLWMICELYDLLHDISGHTYARLAVVKQKTVLMMAAFKRIFGPFSPSNCSFQKFHFTLHLTWVIEWWGSLRAVDTCFGEAKQGDVRKSYSQTSRRRASLHTELAMLAARERLVHHRARGFGVNLNPVVTRRPVSDRFRGTAHHYSVATGATTPHLRLPEGVRGASRRRALEEYNADHDMCFGENLDSVTVHLYTSMRVTAEGSPDPIIFHANHDLYNKPWYDYVRLLAQDDDGKLDETGSPVTGPEVEGLRYAFWAGQLRTFLQVSLPDGDDHLLALVHLYGVKDSRGQKARRINSHKYWHDIDSDRTKVHRGVPFAYMEACKWPGARGQQEGGAYMWMVDTEVISRGLWAQKCFDSVEPQKFWFLRRSNF